MTIFPPVYGFGLKRCSPLSATYSSDDAPSCFPPPFHEGRSASGVVGSLPPAHPGKLNGGSAYYPDIAPSYPSQTEHQLEMNLEYDAQSLDELERRFLEETIELTKDQNKEEDKENARHREVCSLLLNLEFSHLSVSSVCTECKYSYYYDVLSDLFSGFYDVFY